MSEQMKDVLQQQQEQKKPQQEEENIVQLVGFMVGNEEFAVHILDIQEIIKPFDYSRVPGTPDYVWGVFNLRGNVIPLINLRQKFHLPPEKINDDTRYIVLKANEDEVAGFVIDKLTEAIRIKESDVEPAPDAVDDGENLIYGVGKKDARLITILRTEGLLKKDF